MWDFLDSSICDFWPVTRCWWGSYGCWTSQSHNAYVPEIVTVYYKWHPLFGQSLRVVRRTRDRLGEHLFCELPDRTACFLPPWMFSAECAQFSLGKPAIAIEALSELRNLLSSLQKCSSCDKASLASPTQEDEREIRSKVHQPATESHVTRSSTGETSSGRTAGTRPRSGRAARECCRSERVRAKTNRRSE